MAITVGELKELIEEMPDWAEVHIGEYHITSAAKRSLPAVLELESEEMQAELDNAKETRDELEHMNRVLNEKVEDFVKETQSDLDMIKEYVWDIKSRFGRLGL